MPAENFIGHLLVSRLNGRNLGEDLLVYKGMEGLEQNLPPVVRSSSVERRKAGQRGSCSEPQPRHSFVQLNGKFKILKLIWLLFAFFFLIC